MENIKNSYYSPKRHGIVIGIILIALGTLFLLFNFEVISGNFKKVVFSWQMLLIVFAAIAFYCHHFFSGTLLLLAGIFFIIPRMVAACPESFGWFGNDFTSIYWPVLLIAIGILIILKLFLPSSAKAKRYRIYADNYQPKRHKCKHNRNGESGYFDKNTAFGSIEEIILDPVFSGGELNCAFGSITLDLRKTALAEGDTELEINAAFGGITLLIPDNWHVETHVNTFMGGFADNRRVSAEIDYSRKLIIAGSFALAGGEIQS
jgi:predicted membrane protein